MQLAGLAIEPFLRDHWQKQPLLIRNPWAGWRNPLEPDELAGLACEEGIEARLVIRDGETLALETGPFADDRFAALGHGPWTLLVQAVDQLVPAVAALKEPFRFLPDWRIDDVMVSFATDGGGVGPHFDQYDVFLVQGAGRRRWRVGPRCDAATPLLPHPDLRLLAGFEPAGEWLLEPGDILYVPPGFAHDGVAEGDGCMTYSIGFRAPSRAELVEGWSAHVAASLPADDRYADPDLQRQPQPGEILPAAIDRLHAMATEALADREGFARWFGRHASQPRYPEQDWRPDEPVSRETVRAMLANGLSLLRNPASRFAFIRTAGDGIVLFADGEAFDCTGEAARLAEALCAAPECGPDTPWAGAEAVVTLVAALAGQGSIAFDQGED